MSIFDAWARGEKGGEEQALPLPTEAPASAEEDVEVMLEVRDGEQMQSFS